MINPKELRIGNLLHWQADHLGAGTSQVTLIKEDGYEIESLCGCYPVDDEMDHIEPIPMTPGWLERFGFRKFADESYHKPAMFTWRILYDDFEKAASYCTCIYPELSHRVHLNIRIEYVHQLQNLYFALTGEELTINQA